VQGREKTFPPAFGAPPVFRSFVSAPQQILTRLSPFRFSGSRENSDLRTPPFRRYFPQFFVAERGGTGFYIVPPISHGWVELVLFPFFFPGLRFGLTALFPFLSSPVNFLRGVPTSLCVFCLLAAAIRGKVVGLRWGKAVRDPCLRTAMVAFSIGLSLTVLPLSFLPWTACFCGHFAVLLSH